jgi:ACS family tartrate transporter-like MFS transporter
MATNTALSDVSRHIEEAVVSEITLQLVPFLFLLYIIAYLDRINVGFAALQMQDQLGFNDTVYGNAAGMFFLGYFLFQIPSNLVLQRIGAKRWICILMVTWGVVSSCTMFVHTARGFYTLRFMLGLAEAGFFPGVILYLKSWFPAEARARTVAWFMTAAALSAVVGGPISGALLELNNKHGLAGWQWMFLLEGVPAIVMGAVVLLYLTDSPENAKWLREEHRVWLINTLERERQNVATGSSVGVVTALNVLLLSFVYFGLNTCSYGISLFLPKMIRSASSVSTFRIGLLTAIPYLAASIAMVLVGLNSDRTGERRLHTGISALVAAGGLVAAAYSTSLPVMMTAMSIAVLAQFSMLGPFWAMPTSLLRGSAAAAGIAFINSVGNLGGFFGPRILGTLKTSSGGFKGGLLVVALTLGLAGCIALLVQLPKTVSPSTSK